MSLRGVGSERLATGFASSGHCYPQLAAVSLLPPAESAAAPAGAGPTAAAGQPAGGLPGQCSRGSGGCSRCQPAPPAAATINPAATTDTSAAGSYPAWTDAGFSSFACTVQ